MLAIQELWIERLAVAVLVVGCGLAALSAHGRSLGAMLGDTDFAAFYCAGSVVRQAADPYRWEPLEACEREQVAEALGRPWRESDFDPAPLPGYAIAPFVPLSLLPYPAAALLWDAVLIGAILGAVATLRALTSLPWLAIAAALAGTAIVASLPYGQFAPLALLALSASGLCWERSRPRAAAWWAILSLVQPATGLAALLALAVWVPRSRGSAAAGIGVLFALSLVTVGWRGDLDYLNRVLPVQALAEAPFRIQLSATWLLHFLGVDQDRALRLAQIDYALMLAAGVLLAPRVARALESNAATVFFPPVAVLLGGTYLHVFQLAAALPFALLLAAHTSRRRAIPWAAIALLSVAWQALGSRSMLMLGALTAAAIVWIAAKNRRTAERIALTAACAALVLVEPRAIGLVSDRTVRTTQSALAFERSGIDPSLAPARHGFELRLDPARTDASWPTLAEKTPFWLALLLLLAAALQAASSTPGGKNMATRRAEGQS